MPATLTILVPDDLLARLQEQAAREGKTPEAVAAETLARVLPGPEEDDPLLKWIGAFESDVPDAAERHDEYLGRAIYDEMTGRAEPNDVR